MKVGSPADNTPVAPATPGRAAPADAKAGPPAAGAPAEASAQVRLSSAAEALLAGVGGASAEFDADKVARIAQSIADGTFKVNAEVIADKLIANAQELLKGPR